MFRSGKFPEKAINSFQKIVSLRIRGLNNIFERKKANKNDKVFTEETDLDHFLQSSKQAFKIIAKKIRMS